MREYTNSEIQKLIDEHIHSERDRLIMKMCFIEGYTYEKIAEKVDLTPRHISRIISKHMEKLNTYLEEDTRAEEPYSCAVLFLIV